VSPTVLVTLADIHHRVNRQWTATLGAIEGEEPSFTAVVAATQIDVALENNTKGRLILSFIKMAILKQQKLLSLV